MDDREETHGLWHGELEQFISRGSEEEMTARRIDLNGRYQTGAYEVRKL